MKGPDIDGSNLGSGAYSLSRSASVPGYRSTNRKAFFGATNSRAKAR